MLSVKDAKTGLIAYWSTDYKTDENMLSHELDSIVDMFKQGVEQAELQ